MHEDAHHLSDLSTDLGVGLLQATVLLVSFVGVLWSLSSGFVFHVWGPSFAIPGYMVWAAVLYAGTASWLSWLVGRPLIRLNGDRYAREAELRFSLVRVNEHIDAISLAAGEADERRRLGARPGDGARGERRIISAIVRLDLGHRRLWLDHGGGADRDRVAGLFCRRHDLRRPDDGGRRVQPGAFLAALVRRQYRRHRRLARDAAARRRLSGSAMLKADELHDVEKRIAFDRGRARPHDASTSSRSRRRLAAPSWSSSMSTIKAGERVLVTGDPGAGKTLFFRAIAGLVAVGQRPHRPAGGRDR